MRHSLVSAHFSVLWKLLQILVGGGWKGGVGGGGFLGFFFFGFFGVFFSNVPTAI